MNEDFQAQKDLEQLSLVEEASRKKAIAAEIRQLNIEHQQNKKIELQRQRQVLHIKTSLSYLQRRRSGILKSRSTQRGGSCKEGT